MTTRKRENKSVNILIAWTFFDNFTIELELFVKFRVGKPFIFWEVEIDPKFFEIFRFFSFNSLEMSHKRLISFFNTFSNDITVHEYFKPELWNFFLSEVVVFGLLFLLGEKLSDFLEISIRKGVLTLNDVINLVNVWFVKFSEFSFHSLLLLGQLIIKFSLLNKVTIDGNGLHLFSESG